MSSFFTRQSHPAPPSSSQLQHPPLALPTLESQSHHTDFPSNPSLIPYPTDGVSPLHSRRHHSASEPINPPHPQSTEATVHAAPAPDTPNPPTSALNDSSAALGAPRPRKKTSSVSKAIKAKKAAVGDSKSPCGSVRGVKFEELPHPLRWRDVPHLGSIIPGPNPNFLSQERFSEDTLPMPHWLDFVLGAMMTRRCKNPWEVTITIAELQPWRVWMAGTGVTWPQKLSSAYDHASHVISRARLSKDATGHFHIIDPSMHQLPPRIDKNKPKTQRRIAQDNEGGTAAAPSPNSIPSLSPVTTGTSRSTVTTRPPTPAFQNGAPDVVDASLVTTPITSFNEGYETESLAQPALQVPTTSYWPSYQQVGGMDALIDYTPDETYYEPALYRLQNTIMDMFTYRS